MCSLGDASVTEGEVSEAFQFAVLKKLPIIYLVQDNNWGSASGRKKHGQWIPMNMQQGFGGMGRLCVDGSDFPAVMRPWGECIAEVRAGGGPFILVQAQVPLLGHHTSGVRREFYRDAPDLAEHAARVRCRGLGPSCFTMALAWKFLTDRTRVAVFVEEQFRQAVDTAEPEAESVSDYVYLPTPVVAEAGDRAPSGERK